MTHDAVGNRTGDTTSTTIRTNTWDAMNWLSHIGFVGVSSAATQIYYLVGFLIWMEVDILTGMGPLAALWAGASK